jgi:hypothetical protein
MGLKYSVKLALAIVGVLALASVSAAAQDITRSEVSLEGTGFFTHDSSGNGDLNRATNTGGLLVGYRYNFNRWFAVRPTTAMTGIHRCTLATHWRACSPTSIS